MSTATLVPETYELEGDDALETLRRTGWWRLLKDSFRRFRYADGFSHSRALAFQVTLSLLPAIIAVVGLATLLHADHFRKILGQAATRLAPGPAGDVVVAAFRHGQHAVGGGALSALVLGLLAALVSAATAMGSRRPPGSPRARRWRCCWGSCSPGCCRCTWEPAGPSARPTGRWPA